MKVAIAVIINDDGKVLITQRPLNTTHGGYWEFPGGKLEQDEMPILALQREIFEEVNLEVLEAEFLTTITHSYDSKKVTLLVYCVHKFQGVAVCREFQTGLRWVGLNELEKYQFPEANGEIIILLKQRYNHERIN